eukprot:SAG11_NODE_455_length_9324_cov_2.103415_3_plen_65_part_00
MAPYRRIEDDIEEEEKSLEKPKNAKSQNQKDAFAKAPIDVNAKREHKQKDKELLGAVPAPNIGT